jgi:hypothetical protein
VDGGNGGGGGHVDVVPADVGHDADSPAPQISGESRTRTAKAAQTRQ